jgi:hypothetical protein
VPGKYRRKCQMCRAEFRSSEKYKVLCAKCSRKSKAQRTVQV